MQKRAEQLLVVEELRERLERISGGSARLHETLPFGVDVIDHHLPGGGLKLGSLHEVSGGGNGAADGAAAALFAAGVAARLPGKVLWCVTRRDLFMPGLTQAGLSQNRVIIVECRDEKGVLDCFEEGLRCNGFGAVMGELAKLPMNASRRLQLAAETSGVTGIAIRRFRRAADATLFGEPTAAVTRWRVSVRPSSALPVPGVGRPRWFLELLRCRGGESAEFEVEACDAKGRLALPADMADGSLPASFGTERAAG
ncbi:MULTISPECIES: ImuA family protein [unclassified Rhizobium]|uniref:ImuA family protein n=1 Tax=unclassified Rhizobium TaxID=2613769 RepID=UPI00247AC127|nr:MULTISPECIES: ImuA family protein [unclassified Rhizobium]MDH7801944.1 protein ImuA [Rhizobium sp. AN70]